MKNYDTPKMEFLHNTSIPEDRAIVFQGTSASSDIDFTKVWDSSGHTFHIPSAKDLNMLGYFPAYRTGEYNSSGSTGFELHDENPNKASWWTPSTRNIVFVKIAAGTDRMATQVNLETGALIGVAKPYIIVGNGSFHGTPEAIANDIHFAVDMGTQWAIVISGYGSIVKTMSGLFTYKDVDMSLALDLDTQGNLIDMRLEYAGLWYGVHKLWHPGIFENPIQTGKIWYYPTLIGINATRAVFLYYVRPEQYNFFRTIGLQSFDYATKKWIALPSPVLDGDPAYPTMVQVEMNDCPFMMTLTSNNTLYMVWMQYQWYSGVSYWNINFRKMTGGVWGSATTLQSGSQPSMVPTHGFVGGSFNNNDCGFVFYFDSSMYLVIKDYTTGSFGSATVISVGGATGNLIVLAKAESNNNRYYFVFSDPVAVGLFGAVNTSGSWPTTRMDNGTGGAFYCPQACMVDDADKALVSFAQHDTSPVLTFWYSRFYAADTWAALDVHESYSGQLFAVAQLGQAYNGSTAVVAMLGLDFIPGTGVIDQGLWVDVYTGGAWTGVTLVETLTNYIFPDPYDNNTELPCYIDSSNNIYVAYCNVDATTPANNFVKVAYYNASTATWTTTTLNTTESKNVYMSGSGDRVLVAWEQSQQVYACLGVAGNFLSVKRISYYNSSVDFCNSWGVVPDTHYIPPLLAMYGGQYLAMMCYARNRNYPPDVYGSYYGEKEAIIANTGFYSP